MVANTLLGVSYHKFLKKERQVDQVTSLSRTLRGVPPESEPELPTTANKEGPLSQHTCYSGPRHWHWLFLPPETFICHSLTFSVRHPPSSFGGFSPLPGIQCLPA